MTRSRSLSLSMALVILITACAWLSPTAPASPTPAPLVSPASPPFATPAPAAATPTRAARAPTASASPTLALSPTPAAPPATPTVTPPAPNPAYSLLTVRLQAIQVSDDDGAHPVRLTPQQVKQWVDKANEIYAMASVRLDYDPQTDFASLKSTVLNGMAGDTDPDWKREVEAGNRVAATYSGKLVVFFIHGRGASPTGGGFSWVDYNFVEMPGFDDTQVCGTQNIGILAHEIGHYFGLSHPFVQTFASLPAAELYLTAHGNDPQAFDGDGLSDTPPDPFISLPAFQCQPVPSVTLNGRVFPLPRLNIMSYYHNAGVDRTELTPQQANLMRWVLALRAKNGMATPTNIGVPGAVEFASLPIKVKSGLAPSVQDMSGFGDAPRWAGDRQVFASGQPGSLLGFQVSVPAAGKYQLNLYATLAPDFATLQTLVDGSPLGPPVDLYAPLVLPSGQLPIGGLELSAGAHTLSFRLTGKNAASAGYSLGLNAYTLSPR
jgi:hypothetical protein